MPCLRGRKSRAPFVAGRVLLRRVAIVNGRAGPRSGPEPQTADPPRESEIQPPLGRPAASQSVQSERVSRSLPASRSLASQWKRVNAELPTRRSCAGRDTDAAGEKPRSTLRGTALRTEEKWRPGVRSIDVARPIDRWDEDTLMHAKPARPRGRRTAGDASRRCCRSFRGMQGEHRRNAA
jgi:hypothetical protein